MTYLCIVTFSQAVDQSVEKGISFALFVLTLYIMAK